MPPKPRRIWSLDDLRDFVNETLCYYEQLEIGSFELTDRVLVRSERPCGVYFCLHGPRQVKFTAIWAADRNMLYFYRATGERYHTVGLPDGPQFCLEDGPHGESDATALAIANDRNYAAATHD
jgi:hypothetical protein